MSTPTQSLAADPIPATSAASVAPRAHGVHPHGVHPRAVATGALAMSLLGGSVGASRELTSAPLFTAQALRYALAALVLLVVAKRGRVPLVRPRGTEWLWLIGVAGVGLVLFNVAMVRGLSHAEPAAIAVGIACVPVVLGVVGPLLERHVPNRRVLIAAVTVTAGSALVEGTGRADAIGLGWAAVVLVCEAGFTLLAVPVLARHGAWGVSLHAVWIGGTMFLLLGLATEGPGSVARLTAGQWAATAYLAVLVTAVAFICWYSTVAALGADVAGVLTGITPVVAALAGMALDGRMPAMSVWLGIGVVCCGLALGLVRRRASRAAARAAA